MNYNIKSNKTGKVKTLLFLCINEDKKVSKIDIKTAMRVEHINILLTLVENNLIKSEQFGEKKVWLNANTYALLKQTREPEQNDNLYYNSNLWKQLYKKYRPNSQKIEFKPAEIGFMSNEKWKAEELQSFFDSDYYLFKVKSIRTYVGNLPELRDWILAKEQGEPIKSQHPDYWNQKYYNNLKTGQEIVSYTQHLRNLGFIPVMNQQTKKLIKWERK